MTDAELAQIEFLESIRKPGLDTKIEAMAVALGMQSQLIVRLAREIDALRDG
ncbi:hypothetical protein [Nocardioides sp. URHA0020]|uniref:hypothetical protein n=1 Tax=Nocardioides sp. URHA0020 TaxID=1380392 RepID=UPI000AB7BD6B|nr:hypothetical protein [Nocardioides sp. URHA0020]